MLAQGQQLVSELEELASGSKRSTLRRHYTPGDYLRYDEASGEYNSLGRSRRSMSATALGRGGGDAYAVLYDRERHHSGSIEGQDISATAGRSATTTNAARYGQYRSRSELAGMGGQALRGAMPPKLC
uniref:Uncharacterized protein n=1 Tax=Meloidogyne enterolobii TaxID=390850 RepID=A0A6V7Y1C3_MELEN|nr:unnamed protein product [Meloidogyne enterolobii]